ncbi:MAG: hypothetical protein AAFZ15_25855 [Bacteroidota bacterium]
MIHKYFLLFFFFLFISTSVIAQLEKTIHQTFDLENQKSISIDLISDSTAIILWAGNTILTETKVRLYDASPSILTHFMDKEQRYAIEADTSGQTVLLYSVNKERKPIRTRSGECPEYVNIRVFVPEEFEKQEGNTFIRNN